MPLWRESGARLRRRCAAEPARQHGKAPLLAALDHGARGVRAVGDRRRTVEHQHRVAARIIEQRFQRRRIARARRVADDVDRVAVAPGRRQHAVEPRDGRRRKLGKPAAFGDQPVGREHGDAAAIGQDGEPVALEMLGMGERLDRIEQLDRVPDAQQAGAAEHRVIDRVVSRQRAGVRVRGLRAFRHPARLDHDDRLGARRDARRRQELARIRDRLDVEQDGPHLRLQRQVVEHVAEIDIRHVAERHHVGKADAARRRPVQHRGDDRARLRDEGEVAGQRVDMREARIQPGIRHQHADHVRARSGACRAPWRASPAAAPRRPRCRLRRNRR